MAEARRLLAAALLDVAETHLELGQRFPATSRQTAVPRHRNTNDYPAHAICHQLGIQEP